MTAENRQNIIVLGHAGHGKTALTAAVLTVAEKRYGSGYTISPEDIEGMEEENREKSILRTVRLSFDTPDRAYEISDGADHMDVVKEMLALPDLAAAAFLVVDVMEGPMPQTREQILLARRLGIPHIIVFLNKCDLADDPEVLGLVETEVCELLEEYEYCGCPVVRGSAEQALESPDGEAGDRIAELLHRAEEVIPAPVPKEDLPFLMEIAVSYRAPERGTLACGTIERGTLRPGDEVEIVGRGFEIRKTAVTKITASDEELALAGPGEFVEVHLGEMTSDQIRDRQMLAEPGSMFPHTRFQAVMYYISREEGSIYSSLGSGNRLPFRIRGIHTYGVVDLSEGITKCDPGDYAPMSIVLTEPAALESGQLLDMAGERVQMGWGRVTMLEDESAAVRYIADTDAEADLPADEWVRKGDNYRDHGMDEKAFACYRKAAELGDVRSQLTAAEYYWQGRGTEQDREQAVFWYRKAAEGDNVTAQYFLGWLCYDGEGAEQDHEQAAYWFGRAAALGDRSAQVMLGHCYRNGEGVARDYGAAADLYLRAAKGGLDAGQYWAAYCYEHGLGVKQDLNQAEYWHREAAARGYKDSQNWLRARIKKAEPDPAADEWYAKGEERRKKGDHERAFIYYMQAAELGHAGAQLRTAECFEQGTGIEQDLDNAAYWYQMAAEQGDPDSRKWLEGHAKKSEPAKKAEPEMTADEWDARGDRNRDQKNDAEALACYLKAAEMGHVDSQFWAARFYELGRGTEQDYGQSAFWYRKSADQGDESARNNLGVLYYYGRGVEQDYEQAVYWFRKAAEQGSAVARAWLGSCYRKGEGVEKDGEQAIYWYRKAADQGNAVAQYYMGYCFEHGIGIKTDLAQAEYWHTKAAEQGDADSKKWLEDRRTAGKTADEWDREGDGFREQEKYKEAFDCYMKAAEMGHMDSQYWVARFYATAKGVEQDYEKAAVWYRKAADQGDKYAQNNLGVLYLNGNGVDKDYGQAVYWCRKAAEQGLSEGQYCLAYFYDHGYGVKRDLEQARYWHEKAAAQGDADSKQWLEEHKKRRGLFGRRR